MSRIFPDGSLRKKNKNKQIFVICSKEPKLTWQYDWPVWHDKQSKSAIYCQNLQATTSCKSFEILWWKSSHFLSSISASHPSLNYDTHPFPLLHKFQSCSSKFFKSIILYLIAGNFNKGWGHKHNTMSWTFPVTGCSGCFNQHPRMDQTSILKMCWIKNT